MRRLSILLVAAVLCVGCGAARGAVRAHGGAGVVSAVGKVGPLTFGISNAGAVERFAGHPDFQAVSTFHAPDRPRYTALAYDCSSHQGGSRIPPAYDVSHTYCSTIYYVSNKTRRLGAFWTSSPQFHTTYGTHPGSSQSYANAHEDALPESGCLGASLSRSTDAASLVLGNRGGKPHQRIIDGVAHETIAGGVVSDFALEQAWYAGSRVAHVQGSSAVGLLFC